MGAFVAAGTGQDLPFEKQVRLEFSLPTSTLPVGSTSRHLSTVFWDGARWVPASDALLSNADGTMKANTWLTSQGFYALVCVVQP